jgi:hypothetical protein
MLLLLLLLLSRRQSAGTRAPAPGQEFEPPGKSFHPGQCLRLHRRQHQREHLRTGAI